jgi:hypothetical protein
MQFRITENCGRKSTVTLFYDIWEIWYEGNYKKSYAQEEGEDKRVVRN